jgi:hypothetical protein
LATGDPPKAAKHQPQFIINCNSILSKRWLSLGQNWDIGMARANTMRIALRPFALGAVLARDYCAPCE